MSSRGLGGWCSKYILADVLAMLDGLNPVQNISGISHLGKWLTPNKLL